MELFASTEALLRIFVFLLYAPVVLISYWKIIPRLSSTAKRIATAFLAAQIILIAISLEIRPASAFERWLWDIDKEWNIPSAFASTQMALVSFAALVTAWMARARPAWQRLYLVGVGLVFLYLGLDEFFSWKSLVGVSWKERYMLVGTAVVVTTVAVAVRSPQRTWIWHLCLLTGLSFVAVGGFALDGFDEHLYFLEESLELLGSWLVLAAMLGHFSDTAPMSKPRVRRALYALPAFWILLLSQSASILPIVISPLVVYSRATAVAFESDLHLRGFKRVREKDLDDIHFHLFLSPRRWDFNGLGYSIHLIDQVSGESVARDNEWADRQYGFWFSGSSYAPIYQQAMELEIPPQAATNRAFWVVLRAWREKDGEYVHQRVLASDRQLLDDTQVILGELVLPAASSATTSVPLAIFDNGFALDGVDMPEHAQSGEIMTIPFAWRNGFTLNTGDLPSETPTIPFAWRTTARASEDYAQFLHFGHDASGTWWVYDQQPLGNRLPTRLWYNGLADRETWQVPLPADLAPGQYKVFTGLYRQSDLERVSVSDADGRSFLDARVPLGSLTIER